ncbi:GIY-YIG nuclease family protein [Clostridium sp. BSD9I1]|uniref:GIY-YIG nuclease family protein n=1 Tax=Clostridium sp. BSD9I1 TaxID=2003589 RepID=UPI00164600B7|nr:GIY-YIG nuclease family protein [Clostridium sp. BSD9I1]
MDSKKFTIKYEFRYNPESKNKGDNNVSTFYDYHQMKIYDSKIYESWKGDEGALSYQFKLHEDLLGRYEGTPEITRFLKRLKDNESIYKLRIEPKRSFRFRDDAAGCYYSKQKKIYKEKFDDKLSHSYAKIDAEKFEEENNIPPHWTYYDTKFSKGLSGLLQQLFCSTLAYEYSKIQWPVNEKESFTFEFDVEERTATLTHLHIYNPDDPYNKYIRNSMRITRKLSSVRQESDNKEKVIDYYLEDKITPWVKYEQDNFNNYINKEEDRHGIYMLYDSTKGFFYVGKAEKVFSRMNQHRQNDEWIKNFNYYRYSLIDPFYEDDIFLIENAAIHDCAMIFNMVANKDYGEKSLSVHLQEGKNIKDICMVNSVRKQTKRPNNKKR